MTNDVDDRAAWRLRTYPLVILLALAAALVFASVTYDASDPSSRLGGDYPAFYGAGSIVADGDWDDLYSAERQQAAQSGYIDDAGGYLYFSYPPFVAGLYGVLAAPGYEASFLIHAVLMGAALLAAIWALQPWLRNLRVPTAALVVVALAFYPVFRSVTGGQNTTVTILLFALAARLDHEDRPFLAGLIAAGILFKPQFGVVVLPLLIVGRRWRMLAGWSVGAVTLYGISAALMGGAWVADWWPQASMFRDLNAAANGVNFVSIPGFFENLFGAGTAVVVGYALAMALGALVALFWWRSPGTTPLSRWSLAAAAAVVAAPQTLYYDSGLLLLLLVCGLPLLGSKRTMAVVVLAAASWVQLGAATLGWSPLAPLVWVAAAGMWWVSWQRSPQVA